MALIPPGYARTPGRTGGPGRWLTTRRALLQRRAAIRAEPIAIPPGRAALRTHHHRTFIPLPRPPGHFPTLGRRPVSRLGILSEPGDAHAINSAADNPEPHNRVHKHPSARLSQPVSLWPAAIQNHSAARRPRGVLA